MTTQPATSRRSRTARMLGAAASALLAVLVLAPSALAAPPNDNWQNALNIDATLGPVEGFTTDATTQSGEPLTPTGSGTCGTTRKMVATTWYRLIGNGGVISVSTAGSNFDTVVAAYFAPTPTSTDPLPCNDDVAEGDLTSAISFQSELGRTYLIQVGGCTGAGCGAASGFLKMTFTFGEPPPPPTPPPPPPVVIPPPPPPDADGDGVPENGLDKCPGSRPTRDANRDGCQDRPRRIRAELKHSTSPYRRAGIVRGSAMRRARLLGVPKGATVRVSCARCQKADARGRTRRFRAYTVTAKRTGELVMHGLRRVLIPRNAALKIVVTAPGRLGLRVLLKSVQRGRTTDVRESESCLAVGSRVKRVPCSTGS